MQQNKKYSSSEAMVDDIYGQIKKARDVFESSVTFISWTNKLFPSFYYLNGISKGMSEFMIMALVAWALIFSSAVINFIRQK